MSAQLPEGAARAWAPLARWISARVVQPILQLLRQGITPDRIALSLAFGLGFGIFPVLGVSSVLCTVVAILLRLNLPAIQLVNYLAAPVQLALVVPFVRLGEHLMSAPPQPISVAGSFELLANGVLHTIQVLWDAIVHAALGWIVVGPALIYALYGLFTPLLVRAARVRGLLHREPGKEAS